MYHFEQVPYFPVSASSAKTQALDYISYLKSLGVGVDKGRHIPWGFLNQDHIEDLFLFVVQLFLLQSRVLKCLYLRRVGSPCENDWPGDPSYF